MVTHKKHNRGLGHYSITLDIIGDNKLTLLTVIMVLKEH